VNRLGSFALRTSSDGCRASPLAAASGARESPEICDASPLLAAGAEAGCSARCLFACDALVRS